MESELTVRYQALQQYLVDRYTDTVVLKFTEIEDILGFTLPRLARLKQEWWANLASRQSDAWTSAQRTAVPNLRAQTVTFARVT